MRANGHESRRGITANKAEVGRIIRGHDGLVTRRDHPELVECLKWLLRKGDLVAVLPGVYAPASRAHERELRLRAAMLSAPDAVLVGAAAAFVSFWPRITFGDITLAVPKPHRNTFHGFTWCTRKVPPELVVDRQGLRFTTPAMTALDLCSTVGGDGIDTVLRSGAASLAQMYEALALTRGREGNVLRRALLLDSRDKPWSAAERLCHRLLRDAGIVDWQPNLLVPSPDSVYYIDIAFERQKVAVEIDGRLHETDRDLFESDRTRQNHLVLQGWTVLRFTWRMLTQEPETVIETVRGALNPLFSNQPQEKRHRSARKSF